MNCNKNYKNHNSYSRNSNDRNIYHQSPPRRANTPKNFQFRNSYNRPFFDEKNHHNKSPRNNFGRPETNFPPPIQAIPVFYAIQPRIISQYQVERPTKPRFLPPDLIQPVRTNRVQFSKAFENISNQSNKIIEVSSPNYLLDSLVRNKLEKSGPIIRYARLSYSLLFAEFATATIAEHAVSRMRRISQLDPKLQNYEYHLTSEEEIAPLILQRNIYSRNVYDIPVCLTVYNFVLPPSFKVESMMWAFDLTSEAEYHPEENLLITYHRTEASVKDFYAAFQEGRSGIPNTYVVPISHLEILREKVDTIIIQKLIDTCMDDLKKMLIHDVIQETVKQVRNKLFEPKKSYLKYLSSISAYQDISVHFTLSKTPLYFHLSSPKTQSFEQKVRRAARQRRKDLITNHALEYEKQVRLNIEEGNIVSFDSIEQPPLESNSSRLTKIHKIDEFTKRKYLKPCALFRQRPYLIARQSGLLYKQSQISSAISHVNQKRKSIDNSSRGNSYFHRFYGKNLYFDKSTIQGFGLFALEPISTDTLICEYVGEVIRSRVADKREKVYERNGNHMYFFTIDDEYVVDATKTGNISRFLNHCCEPNCRSQIITIGNMRTISFYAIKNIKAHEEITFNYKMENEFDKTKLIKCYCGSKSCSGYLNYTDNFQLFSRQSITFNDAEDDF